MPTSTPKYFCRLPLTVNSPLQLPMAPNAFCARKLLSILDEAAVTEFGHAIRARIAAVADDSAPPATTSSGEPA